MSDAAFDMTLYLFLAQMTMMWVITVVAVRVLVADVKYLLLS